METNVNAASQIIIMKKIMAIENVSFGRAIEILDALDQAGLINYYMHEMHKEEFEDTNLSNTAPILGAY